MGASQVNLLRMIFHRQLNPSKLGSSDLPGAAQLPGSAFSGQNQRLRSVRRGTASASVETLINVRGIPPPVVIRLRARVTARVSLNQARSRAAGFSKHLILGIGRVTASQILWRQLGAPPHFFSEGLFALHFFPRHISLSALHFYDTTIAFCGEAR